MEKFLKKFILNLRSFKETPYPEEVLEARKISNGYVYYQHKAKAASSSHVVEKTSFKKTTRTAAFPQPHFICKQDDHQSVNEKEPDKFFTTDVNIQTGYLIRFPKNVRKE